MSLRKTQKGVAAVEFAILLIPMILMVFGITELGRAFYQYNTLAKATRDAARYLSFQAPGTGADVAKHLAVYGNKAGTGDPLAPGLTEAMVQIDLAAGIPICPSGCGTINTARVRIEGFPFVSWVPFVIPDITFGAIATEMRQGPS